MKVAGTLLMILGVGLAILTFAYESDTGRTSPIELIAGIVMFIIGIILYNIKTNKNKDKEKN